MDFLLAFIFGYFFKEVVSYLKRLANEPIQNDWDKTHNDEERHSKVPAPAPIRFP